MDWQLFFMNLGKSVLKSFSDAERRKVVELRGREPTLQRRAHVAFGVARVSTDPPPIGAPATYETMLGALAQAQGVSSTEYVRRLVAEAYAAKFGRNVPPK
jgi:hypothetical protein